MKAHLLASNISPKKPVVKPFYRETGKPRGTQYAVLAIKTALFLIIL